MIALTERQFQCLRWLDDKRWVRPMDIGARDGSWHSAVLAQLCRKGFAVRRHRGSDRSFEYRRTSAGRVRIRGERPVDVLRCGYMQGRGAA